MAWQDISLPISDTLVRWPGDPDIEIKRVASLEDGDPVNVSMLSMGVHAGTHVDAPLHFLDNASPVDFMDLEALIGPARVVHLTQEGHIGAEQLNSVGLPPATERLLFRTRNSDRWTHPSAPFDERFVAIAEDGARWLVDHGVRLVGVDYLSVAPWEASEATHRILLSAGVVIVEGLDMTGVSAGAYDLICLPLKLMGAEGSPARAVLRERVTT
jgi:arylformamidase